MERIFIQIASYRDPQCGPTIANLWARARYPERLSFGICYQWRHDDERDVACAPSSLPSLPHLRLDLQDARNSLGVCWARSRCQQMWEGEEFTLQIDSHMRAEPDWDLHLLESWNQANHPNAVLSCYPNGYTIKPGPKGTYQEVIDRDKLPIMAAKEFGDDGILRLQGISAYPIPDGLPPVPTGSAFVSAGMLFGPASLIRDVPYDPDLYFYGEETTLAARLWTNGYQLFNPNRPLLYHLYKSSGNTHSTHWSDHENWSELNRKSIERSLALLVDNKDLGIYGLGSLRTLQDYQQWSGVNFKERTISDRAKSGQFGAAP